MTRIMPALRSVLSQKPRVPVKINVTCNLLAFFFAHNLSYYTLFPTQSASDEHLLL